MKNTITIDTAPNVAAQLVKDHPDAEIIVVAVGSTRKPGKLSLSILVPGHVPAAVEEKMRTDIAYRVLHGATAPGPRSVRVEK